MNSSAFSRPRLALFALVVCAIESTAFAGNTWTGGGSGAFNWSDNANWGGSAPAYGTLTFSGGLGTANTDDSITSMNQLAWSGSSTWTLNQGGATALGLYDYGGTQAKIQNLGTGLVTINLPINFAASNASTGNPNGYNPFGEINSVSGDITFGPGGTLTVNGPSVNGIKSFGSGHTITFNNTVNAAGKWIGMTASTGNTLVIGGPFTSGDIYVMNGGTLALNAGGSLNASALRLGGDFGKTGNQNQTQGGTFQLTAPAGGQSFGGTINPVSGNTSNALLINAQNTSGTDTLSGPVYLDSPLTIQNSAGGSLLFSSATIDVKSQRLTLNNSGPVTVTNAIISSTNGGSVLKSGPGSLTVNANASYLGGTTVSAGTVFLGVTNALPSTSGSLALGGSGATLDLNGFNQTVVGFNDNGGQTTGLVINNGTADATFTINDSGLDNYAGVIADGSRLVGFAKSGTGVMTLSGPNAYSGATSINGGTLALGAGGSLGNTAITINSGATFSPIQGSSAGTPSGASGASLTVTSGATLDMTSGGTGTVGTFTLNPGANSFSGTALNLQGGTLIFNLASNSADQLLVNSGTASVTGVNYVTLNTSGLSSLTLGTYTLISTPAGGLAGAFKFNSGSPLYVVSPSIIVNAGGNSYRLSLSSTSTALQLVVAPASTGVPVNIMPLGASITEGASADNPYWGGGYRTKLYQYLANDGRYAVNFLGSNTRLFDYNWSGPTNPLITFNQQHDEGHFGSTTSQILNNLNGYDNSNASGSNNGGYWLKPGNGVNPNYVTLNIGGNDYVSNANDPNVVNRLSQIITTVSALRPGVTVLVSNLAWRTQVGYSIDTLYNPYVPGMVYNLILNGYHVQFVDVYSVLSPNDSNANLSSDQIHPSQAGYNLMADTWWKSFAYGAAFWTGTQNNFWNTLLPDGSTNWTRDYTLTADRQALLDSGTDVYFNSNNIPITTNLSANVSVRGLNFAAGASAPVTIAGNNTITLGTGGMTVQAGTGAHIISANVAVGTAEMWSNISSNPLTVNGALSGSSSLELVGPSFFNLGGANTNTGNIAIDSGGVWLSPSGSLSGQGFVYVGSGAPANANANASFLSANTGAPVPNAIVTNKADTGSGFGSGTRTIGSTNATGTATFAGAIYLNGGVILAATANGTAAFTNTIADGSDSGNVSHAVTIGGTGTVLLGSPNTYSGGTSINSGTLQVGATGQLPGTGFVFVGNGGPSYANVNASLLSANTTTAIGNAIVTNKADTGPAFGTGTRVIGGANSSGTSTYNSSIYLNGGAVLNAASGGTVLFANPIANGSDTGNVSHNVTIAGGGIVTLGATNTFTGSTTVTGGGTLQLNGVIPGSVTVNTNSWLTGTGTINQNLTIDNGGIAQFNGGTFTINGNIINNGLVILSNGAQINGASQSFVNNGTLDLITAGNFALPSGFQNHGVILDSSVVEAMSISKLNTTVSITIDSYTGHTYQLQVSTAPSSSSFTNLGDPQMGSTGAPLTFTDTNATGSSGFYHILVAP